MSNPRDLLQSLFSYIEEQLKDINPRGYQLEKIPGTKIIPTEIAQLPGVDLDLNIAGDHIWVRVKRLKSTAPPEIKKAALKKLIKVSGNPLAQEPSLDEDGITQAIAEQ